jgi:hypothetical protein
MDARLQDLGDGIEAQWCAENYAEERFPQLAADALRRADLPGTLGLGEVLRWSLDTRRLPAQRDLHSRFGDPAITLFTGPRFCIDVYVWFTATTALHQHGFAGAFQVLEGSSIHAQYTFQPTRDVNPYFRLGRLDLKGCELLDKGAVQEILPGSDYIHRLYHLDHPSATLVIRTFGSPGHQPQFSYLPPCVAMDPFFEDATAMKRLQCLGALFRANDPEAVAAAAAWIGRADLHTTFQILSLARHLLGRHGVDRLFGVNGDDTRFGRLRDLARGRHGDVVDGFEAVFLEQDRLDQLVALRSSITEPDLRFFLALLLNVEERSVILALVRQRFPEDDPRLRVLAWTGALARTRVMGSPLPNALGVAGFDDYDALVLEHLIDGATDAEVLVAMAQDDEAVQARVSKLRAAPVLRHLLRPVSA